MKKRLPILLFGTLALASMAFTSCEKDSEEPKEYSITVTSGAGGSVETVVDGVAATRAAAGAEVTLTATADEGYVFNGWSVESGDVKLSDNPATFAMPSANVSVRAEFISSEAPVYKIAVSSAGHGSAEASAGGEPVIEAAEGTEITLTATAEGEYVFSRWIVERGEVELTDAGASPATFRMPAEDVSVKAEFVEIPINVFDHITDPSFLYYCRDMMGFDTNGDGVLSLEEARTVKKIEVNEWGLSSLEGIEYFTSLTFLSCYSNIIAEIDVSKNTELTHLHVGTNKLTELDVTKNTKLTELYFNRNLLTEVDLSKCPDLELLYSHDCMELTSLDVSHNPKLKRISTGTCPKLASINLSSHPELARLDCYDAQLTSLDVSKCPALEVFICINNELTSLDVSNCTRLTQFWCSGNQITSLDISKCTELKDFYCYGNRMTELDASSMASPNDYSLGCGVQTSDGTTPQTLTLTLREEQKPYWETYMVPYQDMNANVEVAGESADIFETIPDPVFKEYCKRFDTDNNGKLSLEEAAAVTNIIVPNMGITSLVGLKYFTGLQTLVCNNNELTSLDVRDNLKLSTLTCDNNKLTELEVRSGIGGEELVKLNCQNNRLTNLSVAGCRKLQTLNCQNNQLTGRGLNLNFTKSLKILNCADNKLTNLGLQLKHTPVLISLDCRNNELTELNVANMEQLGTLTCNNNSLTSLDISGCTSLRGVSAYENRLSALDASDMAAPGGYSLFCGDQTSDGSTAQTLTLTLREEQKPRWENTLVKLEHNGNVKLAD